jgi:hypothetical protein
MNETSPTQPDEMMPMRGRSQSRDRSLATQPLHKYPSKKYQVGARMQINVTFTRFTIIESSFSGGSRECMWPWKSFSGSCFLGYPSGYYACSV